VCVEREQAENERAKRYQTGKDCGEWDLAEPVKAQPSRRSHHPTSSQTSPETEAPQKARIKIPKKGKAKTYFPHELPPEGEPLPKGATPETAEISWEDPKHVRVNGKRYVWVAASKVSASVVGQHEKDGGTVVKSHGMKAHDRKGVGPISLNLRNMERKLTVQ